MAAGDNQQKQLVQLLRALDFNKLDLSYMSPEVAPGKYEEGYDRYGKYKVRWGWGTAWVLTALAALVIFQAFFPRDAYDYLDPELVWIRSNSYWIIPVVLVSAFFVRKADKKVERAETKKLLKALEVSGLEIVADPQKTITGAEYPELMATYQGTFKVKNDSNLKVIFGTTRSWWDPLSKPITTGRAALPIGTLFIYVAIDSLCGDSVFASPFRKPNWDTMPPLTDKAKQALSRLASKYLVRLGEGGLLIAYARDANNGLTSSLENTTLQKRSWQILYTLMSSEVADIVEGLS